MPDHRYANCRICHRHRTEVGELSWTGLCGDCGVAKENANALSLHYKRGPEFEHWRRRCLAAFGVGIFDQVEG